MDIGFTMWLSNTASGLIGLIATKKAPPDGGA
jgi:hypothetical protein